MSYSTVNQTKAEEREDLALAIFIEALRADPEEGYPPGYPELGG